MEAVDTLRKECNHPISSSQAKDFAVPMIIEQLWNSVIIVCPVPPPVAKPLRIVSWDRNRLNWVPA
jgi:hypothetical protein